MLLPQSALPPLSTLQVLLLMLHLTTTLRVAVLAIAFVSTCPELHVPAAHVTRSLVDDWVSSKYGSVCVPQPLQPTQGKAIFAEPVSTIREARCGGVPMNALI